MKCSCSYCRERRWDFANIGERTAAFAAVEMLRHLKEPLTLRIFSEPMLRRLPWWKRWLVRWGWMKPPPLAIKKPPRFAENLESKNTVRFRRPPVFRPLPPQREIKMEHAISQPRAGIPATRVDVDRPLENIERLAGRVESAVDQIDYFIGRFQPRPPQGEAANSAPMPSSNYSWHLDRLGRAISRLENLTEELNTIG